MNSWIMWIVSIGYGIYSPYLWDIAGMFDADHKGVSFVIILYLDNFCCWYFLYVKVHDSYVPRTYRKGGISLLLYEKE